MPTKTGSDSTVNMNFQRRGFIMQGVQIRNRSTLWRGTSLILISTGPVLYLHHYNKTEIAIPHRSAKQEATPGSRFTAAFSPSRGQLCIHEQLPTGQRGSAMDLPSRRAATPRRRSRRIHFGAALARQNMPGGARPPHYRSRSGCRACRRHSLISPVSYCD